MKKILAIFGPTSTGKTDLALSLAKKFNGELVSCDSRQVYTGLDIGTGKMPGQDVPVRKHRNFWEMDGIKVWLYDVVDPKTQFTVKDYVEKARKVINDITKRGKLPIIVGGTGLYLKALIEGLPSLDIPTDEKLRGELNKLTLGDLQNKLHDLSPTKWESLNNSEKNNKRRLLRSIELLLMNPYKITSQISNLNTQNYKILKIGLTAPRQVLYKRIGLRLANRISQGLIKEGKKLQREGITLARMRELGLEYRCLTDYLEGRVDQEELVKKLEVVNRQYAKRQLTWFKNEKEAYWFDVTKSFYGKVEKLVRVWYDAPYDEKD